MKIILNANGEYREIDMDTTTKVFTITFHNNGKTAIFLDVHGGCHEVKTKDIVGIIPMSPSETFFHGKE